MKFKPSLSDRLTIDFLLKSTLTPIQVPIHTKYGTYMATRYRAYHMKNLTPVNTKILDTYKNILSSIDPNITISNVQSDSFSVEITLDTDKYSTSDIEKLLFNSNTLKDYDTFFVEKHSDGIHIVVSKIGIHDNMPKDLDLEKDRDDFFGDINTKYSVTESFIYHNFHTDPKRILAICAYANGGDGFSKFLNTYLRKQKRQYTQDNYDKYSTSEVTAIEELGKHIDDAIAQFDLYDDIYTYRTVSAQNSDGSRGMLDKLVDCYKENKPFVEEGYCSSSLKEGAFHGAPHTNQIIYLKIRVPKGSGRGAYIASLSKYRTEYEFLLRRSTVFKIVTDMSKIDTSKSVMEIELEAIGSNDISWEKLRKNRMNLLDTSSTRPQEILDYKTIRIPPNLDKYFKDKKYTVD